MREGMTESPVSELGDVPWLKSSHSNPNGNCAALVRLPNGDVAFCNTRNMDGTALVYTPAEIEALFAGIRGGEFDHLLA